MYDVRIDTRQGSAEYVTPQGLAPALGARQDGSAGADTSRGLLTTLLGEFVLPLGGSAWTRTLVEVMERLDVRDKSTRQALTRLEARGWLGRERIGRQTRWSLTEISTALLTAGAERIYSFGQQPREWDGRWVVLLASVPERDRSARYRMGQGLGWAGFGSIAQGVWVSPWVEQEPVAVDLLADLNVEATSFRAELGLLGSGPDVAAQAWDLPVLSEQYSDFLVHATRQSGDVVADLAFVVHRWRRFPFLDPDLPRELLPDDWPGTRAAHRFSECRGARLEEAFEWWRQKEAANAPADWADQTADGEVGRNTRASRGWPS